MAELLKKTRKNYTQEARCKKHQPSLNPSEKQKTKITKVSRLRGVCLLREERNMSQQKMGGTLLKRKPRLGSVRARNKKRKEVERMEEWKYIRRAKKRLKSPKNESASGSKKKMS